MIFDEFLGYLVLYSNSLQCYEIVVIIFVKGKALRHCSIFDNTVLSFNENVMYFAVLCNAKYIIYYIVKSRHRTEYMN